MLYCCIDPVDVGFEMDNECPMQLFDYPWESKNQFRLFRKCSSAQANRVDHAEGWWQKVN